MKVSHCFALSALALVAAIHGPAFAQAPPAASAPERVLIDPITVGPQKWRHGIEGFCRGAQEQPADYQKRLNARAQELGALGWEMVSVSAMPSPRGLDCVLFGYKQPGPK